MGAVKLVSTSGSVTLEAEDTAGASTVVIPKAGIVSPDSLRTELNASGTAPIYACRAWVNFNGQGTVAIRASGNVSSITDNGVGDYTVNFTNALEDNGYEVSSEAQNLNSGVRSDYISVTNQSDYSRTSTSYRFYVASGNSGAQNRYDSAYVTLKFTR